MRPNSSLHTSYNALDGKINSADIIFYIWNLNREEKYEKHRIEKCRKEGEFLSEVSCMAYTADEVQEMLHIGRNSIYDYLGEVINGFNQIFEPKWKNSEGFNIKFKPFEFLSEAVLCFEFCFPDTYEIYLTISFDMTLLYFCMRHRVSWVIWFHREGNRRD